MQTVIHVYCSAGRSLRDRVAKDDRHLKKFDLYVESQLNPARRDGWAKIKTLDDAHGAINVEWDQDALVLVCRVITRGGDPAPIIGRFVGYLLSHHFARIRAMTVVPRTGR
jgi:hypothetical protein